jgi:DNA-binding HxlR family transcriptional regulator
MKTNLESLNELQKSNQNNENCAVTVALKLLRGKWKTAIIYLISLDVNRFGQLQKMLPECSKRMMTSRLRELERDGIIHRKVFAQVPPKVIYTLTQKGENLKPVFSALKKWGNENFMP